MRRASTLAALFLLAFGPLWAQVRPQPVNDFSCSQEGDGVLLEWNIAFFAPIEAWVVLRDGEPITRLPPGASSYFDAAVKPGPHTYALHAINFTGETIDLGKCEVVVVESGLRCKAGGNSVTLEWGPILIDIAILKFRVSRDGETIALLPPDQLTFTDQVFSLGTYKYAVHAVTTPESEFLVGTCTAAVDCFGVRHQVDGLTVHLAWEGPPVLSPLPITYVVTRDNELVSKTQSSEIKDSVPGPGTYAYQVVATFGGREGVANAPDILVGACSITVPRGDLPPPRGLTCRVELVPIEPGPLPLPFDPAASEAVDADGDGVRDSLVRVARVHLSWSNPVAYDKIVIARNKALIATLDGAATTFVDRVRAGGDYVYSVHGVAGDRQSDPAVCRVEVPPPLVLPPQDLSCRVLDISPVPFDPATNVDRPIVALPAVVLSWSNPIRYAKIAILRDGAELTRLEGSATAFHDFNPPAGVHVYGVQGILADGRTSPIVECRVEVGVRPVPPVFNLQCEVSQPANSIAVGSVTLVWENAAAYDRVLVLKDGTVIFEDTGELRKYIDRAVAPGVHEYCVVAVIGERRSRTVCCQVVIDGPSARNLLYFSASLLEPVPVDLGTSPVIPDPLPPFPGNRITCLADNNRPLEAWSFGVASDPSFIVPAAVDLDGTATQAFHGGAGPDFIDLDILADGSGVTMGVIVSTDASPTDPPETLPAGRAHRLLNIQYAGGPRGAPGETHAVKYSDGLGSPPVAVIFVIGGLETSPATRAGWVSIPGVEYLRGDANGDGGVDISDAKRILDYLFLGGEAPGCMESANANASTQVNIADPTYVLNFLFLGGPPPPAPFPACAPAAAPLGCDKPGLCPQPLAARG